MFGVHGMSVGVLLNPVSLCTFSHTYTVERPSYCVEKWSNLLSFGGTVLVKPRRGGRKHNITKTILARITDWRLKGPSQSMKAELESTSNRKPRVNKYDPDKFLASIVATKLQEGDSKPAIRLICSEDKPRWIPPRLSPRSNTSPHLFQMT